MAREPVVSAAESAAVSAGSKEDQPDGAEDSSRRDLLGVALNAGVVLSLAASYGTLAGHAVRYLVPSQSEPKAWLYVAACRGISMGSQVKYTAPSGATIAVARVAEGDLAESFIALSSTCPHMGCQVLWEGGKNRFFCPCHNGVFNERGEGTAGPPKGQSLARYPIQVENGLLFVEVPLTALPREQSSRAHACVQPASAHDGPGMAAAREPRRLSVLSDGERASRRDGDESA